VGKRARNERTDRAEPSLKKKSVTPEGKRGEENPKVRKRDQGLQTKGDRGRFPTRKCRFGKGSVREQKNCSSQGTEKRGRPKIQERKPYKKRWSSVQKKRGKVKGSPDTGWWSLKKKTDGTSIQKIQKKKRERNENLKIPDRTQNFTSLTVKESKHRKGKTEGRRE